MKNRYNVIAIVILFLLLLSPSFAFADTLSVLNPGWREASAEEIIGARDQLTEYIRSNGLENAGQAENTAPQITPLGEPDDKSKGPVPERPSFFSYVYDYTDETLDKEHVMAIIQYGKELYSTTGVQAIALVTNSFGGISAADYGTDVINQWGIGSAERNDGVIIVLATEDRAIQINTGTGVDNVLTDGICGQILDDNLYLFEEGKFGDGMVAVYRDVCLMFNPQLPEGRENQINETENKTWNSNSAEDLGKQ